MYKKILNMKNLVRKTFLAMAALLCAMAVTSSCSSDDELSNEEAPIRSEKCTRMVLHGGVTPFKGGTTRAGDSAWEWQDGAVVYIQFHTSDSTVVRGHASYSKADDEWEVSYAGSIEKTGTCEIYFFDSVSASDKHKVSLSGAHAIYADMNGQYLQSDGIISVSAMLVPITSRIRFKGNAGASIYVKGISNYASYDADENRFTTTSNTAYMTVDDDGYTPYCYCVFTDSINPMLSIELDGEGIMFQKVCEPSVLKVGDSGYMTIPSEDINKGWDVVVIYDKTFTVNGVPFTMKYVEAGTFLMGESIDGNDVSPIHSVTISKPYYIGETEVTQALWKAVTEYAPTSDGSLWRSWYGEGDSYPAYYVSYQDVQSFITKLNSITGKTFRMPTEAEWEYAAKGGNNSKRYKYSGSNVLADVAWFTDNSSNCNPVKTKAANELGIYDMSGNLGEWCSDWFEAYSSKVATDPTGPASGASRVCRGGSWYDDVEACRSTVRSCHAPSYRSIIVGVRLALSTSQEE